MTTRLAALATTDRTLPEWINVVAASTFGKVLGLAILAWFGWTVLTALLGDNDRRDS